MKRLLFLPLALCLCSLPSIHRLSAADTSTPIRSGAIGVLRVNLDTVPPSAMIASVKKQLTKTIDIVPMEQVRLLDSLYTVLTDASLQHLDVVFGSPQEGLESLYVVLHQSDQTPDAKAFAQELSKALGLPISDSGLVIRQHENVFVIGTPPIVTDAIQGNPELSRRFKLAFANSSKPICLALALTGDQRTAMAKTILPALPSVIQEDVGTLIRTLQWARLDFDPADIDALQMTLASLDAGAMEAAVESLRQFMLKRSGMPLPSPVAEALEAIALTQVSDGLLVKLPSEPSGFELASLLTDRFVAARSNARRVQKMNDLKQIGLAFHNFHAALAGFPPVASFTNDGTPMLSWRVYLLPYIGEEELYKRFRLDEPWNSEHNRALIEEIPAIYEDLEGKAAKGQTRFLAIQGKGMAFTGKKTGIKIADFKDGLSNTLLVIEVGPEEAIPWTRPMDFEVGEQAVVPGSAPGFLALVADGSVRFIESTIDPAKLRHLMTRNEGIAVERD